MDNDRLTGGALQFFHRFRVLPRWPMTAPVRECNRGILAINAEIRRCRDALRLLETELLLSRALADLALRVDGI